MKKYQNFIGKVYYESKLAKIILFPGFSTIMIFGMILTKKKKVERLCDNKSVLFFKPDDERHEKIHCMQWWDYFVVAIVINVIIIILSLVFGLFHINLIWCILMVIFPFVNYYISYIIEYFISLIYNLIKGNKKISEKGYDNSSFEMEAYDNEESTGYVGKRKFFGNFKYYGKI